jgi:hypothetical protein
MTETIDIEHFKNQLRVIRNDLLKETDWTQFPDVSMTEEKRSEWATYRQALRDLMTQEIDYESMWNGNFMDWSQVNWPAKPEST